MRSKPAAAAVSACLFAAHAGAAAAAAGPVTGGPNTYTAAFSVSAAGSVAAPAAISLVETLGTGSTTPGNVAAPLVDIKTTIFGVRTNGRYFPRCSERLINEENGHSGRWNGICPKGSLVASGHVQAALTSPTSNLAGPGAPCSLRLWVYNGAPGKLTFFFTTSPRSCDGIATGAAAAWTGTVKQAGQTMIADVPEPADVSYDAGNIGLFGSLETEKLTFRKVTVKRDGDLIPFIESTGCRKGARAFSATYKATTSNSPSAASESRATVRGFVKC